MVLSCKGSPRQPLFFSDRQLFVLLSSFFFFFNTAVSIIEGEGEPRTNEEVNKGAYRGCNKG